MHVNGFVSLGSPPYPPYPAWYPYLYAYYSTWYSVIAPFWTDIDLRYTDGLVYFGHIARSSENEQVSSQAAEVYEAVRQLIRNEAGDAGFLPTQVITVTWHNVSPYPGYWYQSQVGLLMILCFDDFLDRCHTCNFLAQLCRASFLARQSCKCDMANRASF